MDDDMTLAWSCAANLLLYDEDPGPRETNVGNQHEPHLVDRREALLDLYARQLLVGLDADYDRIVALRGRCQNQAASARTLRGAWQVVRARRRPPHPSPWPEALSALTGESRHELAELWAVGVDLAELAAQMVTNAAADQNPRARARLLASTRHTLTFDVIGSLVPPDVEHQAAADLAEQLREIDTDNGPEHPPRD